MNVRFSFQKFVSDTVDGALQQLMRWLVEPEHRDARVAALSHAYGPAKSGGDAWSVVAVLTYPESENTATTVEVA
jgi:hypothetical protein